MKVNPQATHPKKEEDDMKKMMRIVALVALVFSLGAAAVQATERPVPRTKKEGLKDGLKYGLKNGLKYGLKNGAKK